LFKTSLQRLLALTRGLLWLAVVVWVILVAGWSLITWGILPRIDEFRPRLEELITQHSGLQVRIGRIEARSGGLVPSFELQDIRFTDAQGRDALRLPQVLVAISPNSLWRLGLDQIAIENPALDIRRDGQGRIWVAGVNVSALTLTDGWAADWVFAQTEWVVRGGSLRWTDELRQRPTLALEQVQAVLRNSGRNHSFRLDATSNQDSADRFSILGSFKEPLLSLRSGHWRQWSGQLFAQFNRLALETLPWDDLALKAADLRPQASGTATVRFWLEVQQGAVAELTVDTLVEGARWQSAADTEVLGLRHLSGRWGVRWKADQQEWWTQDLRWELTDGLRWPGGSVRLSHTASSDRWSLAADRLDLQPLVEVVKRLPVPVRLRDNLSSLEPQGLIEQLQAQWGGGATSDNPWQDLHARGRVKGLALKSQQHPLQPAVPLTTHMGRPGMRGVSADFDFNPEGGTARVSLQSGRLEWPGIFEDPVIEIDRLTADVAWQWKALQQLALQVTNLKFSNADAQGEAQFKWQASEAQQASVWRAKHGLDFGTLDLQGSLSRADVTKVAKYLPLDVPKAVRDYLNRALTQGMGSQVAFKTRGDLNRFPFQTAESGEFRITAALRGVAVAVDSQLPQLSQLQGDLRIDHTSLTLKNISTRLSGPQALRIQNASLVVPDLFADPELQISLDSKGPLQDLLLFTRGLSLPALSSSAASGKDALVRALAGATVSGASEVQLKLKVPLRDPSLTTVQGRATLLGNDVSVPDLPKITRARGVVQFTEAGFVVRSGQARALGGDMSLEGGSMVANAPTLKVQGAFTADALRQAGELGVVSQLARYANGGANYQLTVQWQRGVPLISVSSTLQGLSLNLPAPFNKTAESALPLRLETALTRESALSTGSAPLQVQLSLALGKLMAAQFVQEVSAQSPVLRGAVSVGLGAGESLPLPSSGVVASVQLSDLDLDDWSRLMTASAGPAAFMPNSLSLRAETLTLGGRQWHRVVAGGSHEQDLWRLNVDSAELSGYLEYRQTSASNPGRVYARLARLSLGPTSARDVEALLEEQPASVPALDIVIDDFELRGRKLGRVEIEAINRNAAGSAGPREWRLNRFNISLPEAVFTASGNWAQLQAQSQGAKRRTVMNFKLDIADSGEFLSRFGMKDLIRQGKGKLEGQVSWQGSPLALDYPTLGGSFNVNMEAGQFLKADPGLAKLLGVLSLQALPRRLTLDFRDVFSEGFAFDFMRGDVLIEQGLARTNNLQMRGVNLAVLMEGRADLAREAQDLKVVVVPEINTNTATLVTTIINPAVGLGSFLAQWILRRPIIESTTQEFHITGSWADPVIKRTDSGASRKAGDPDRAVPR
jgi:uncharacterized protein (TIGR02099 family)